MTPPLLFGEPMTRLGNPCEPEVVPPLWNWSSPSGRWSVRIGRGHAQICFCGSAPIGERWLGWSTMVRDTDPEAAAACEAWLRGVAAEIVGIDGVAP